MHTSHKAGISGGKGGAYSIVMSGGYQDDIDNGDSMCVANLCFRVRCISPGYRLYTGAGGRGDDNQYGGGGSSSWGGGSGNQTEDQSFKHKDNHALLVSGRSLVVGTYLTIFQVSSQLGKPVRVIRGYNLKSKYAPRSGFVVGDTTEGAVNSCSLDTAMTVFTKWKK